MKLADAPGLRGHSSTPRGAALLAELYARRFDAIGPVLCLALLCWLNGEDDGPDYFAMLGLPTTRTRARNKLRDHSLISAAELLAPGGSLPEKTAALKKQIDSFALRRWPAWQGSPAAPVQANQVERHLHRAFVMDCGKRRRGEQHTIDRWSVTYIRKILE